MEIRKITTKGLAWMLSGTAAQYIVQLAVLVVLARLLNPAEFGAVAAASLVVRFLSIFSELGVAPALVQKNEVTDADRATATSISIISGASLAFALVISAKPIASFFNMPVLAEIMPVMSLMPLILALTVVGQATLQRDLNFRMLAKINLLSHAIASIFVAIPLALLGYGAWSLVIAQVSQGVVLLVLLKIGGDPIFRIGYDKRSFAFLMRFGIGQSLARVANAFAAQADNLVVGRAMGAEALGFYSRSYQLMSVPAMLLGGAMDKVFFPAMASIKNENERLKRIYMAAVGVCALLAFPLSSVMITLSSEIIGLALGQQWLPAADVFAALCSCLVFRMSYKMSDSLALAKGAVYGRAWRQFIYGALVAAGAWFGKGYGLMGVGLGVALAVFVNFLLMLHLSKTLIHFSWFIVFSIFARHLFVAILVGGASLIGKTFLLECGVDSVLIVLPIGVACAAVVFILLWCLAPKLFGVEGQELQRLGGQLFRARKRSFENGG